jgi:hypothetical protein
MPAFAGMTWRDGYRPVMAGHSRSKNGVAEFTLGLAEGKTRGLAYAPAIHVLLNRRKEDVDARIRGHDVEGWLTTRHGRA